MKLVDRKTFLGMPAGTVYCKGVPMAFEGICIKGETWDNDWVYFDPTDIEAHDSGESFDRLDEMLEKGVGYPMSEAWGRDGCFDADAIFLIFEAPDLERLRDFIDAAVVIQSRTA